MEHITINSDRSVTVPVELRKIGVQYDHNVNTIEFVGPRYSSNVDLSTMTIYINYILSDKTPGKYKAENVIIDDQDDSLIRFNWTITRNVTKVSGILSCLVCAKKTDEEGNEINHWNTDIFRLLSVSEGMENDLVIQEQYPDVITSLIQNVNEHDAKLLEFSGLDTRVTDIENNVNELKEDLVKVEENVYDSLNQVASGKTVFEKYKRISYELGQIRSHLILDGITCHSDIMPVSAGDSNYHALFDGSKYKVEVCMYDSVTGDGMINSGYVTTSPLSFNLSSKAYARINIRMVDGSQITEANLQEIISEVRISNGIQNLLASKLYVTEASNTAVTVSKQYTNQKTDGIVVTVGADKQYANLRTAIDAISPTKDKHYTILLDAGEYDIKSYYTDAEISASDFVGLKIPDYVTLIGVGGKENTILKWEHPTNTSKISPINLSNNVSIIGLTVKGNNTRYVVHDDFATVGVENKRYIKDCDFISDSLVFDYIYGSGEKGGSDWYFENCSFLAPIGKCAFLQHNNTNETKASYLHFKNCRFRGSTNVAVVLSSLNNGTTSFNHAYFEGCKIFNSTGANAKITLNENSASAYGSGIKYKVSGYGNKLDSVIINNTDGEDYSSFVDLI